MLTIRNGNIWLVVSSRRDSKYQQESPNCKLLSNHSFGIHQQWRFYLHDPRPLLNQCRCQNSDHSSNHAFSLSESPMSTNYISLWDFQLITLPVVRTSKHKSPRCGSHSWSPWSVREQRREIIPKFHMRWKHFACLSSIGITSRANNHSVLSKSWNPSESTSDFTVDRL